MEQFDVVIIGAGIAGSVLGKILADQDVKVMLAEKDEYSGKTTACGGLFDMPYFERYVTDASVIEQKINKNTFVMPWGDVQFACDQLTVKRRIFDRHLAENAAKSGADLRNRTRALNYKVEKPGDVKVHLKNLNTKETYQVRAKVIAFADGPQTLAKNNPRFDAEKNKPYWAYAYAYEVDGIPIDADEIKIYLDLELFPWGYGWIFPNKNDSNIGVGTINAEVGKGIKLKDKLFYFIESFDLTKNLLKDREVVDKKGGFIPMWLIDHFSDESQLVLGDAAGMVSPLFGAGIDYAIEAAEAAAPVIIEALGKDDFSAEQMYEYDRKINDGFLKDLKKQMLVARIIITSLRFGKTWPIKVLAAIAFGMKYTRWNKIKIMLYPLLGVPQSIEDTGEVLAHK